MPNDNRDEDGRHLWSIILAGGEGDRLRPLTEQWLGYHVPKQYCTFVGQRSMLQHTIDRVARLTPAERRLTVIGRNHLELLAPELPNEGLGSLLLQPVNRGTLSGIFLPLTYVRARDPHATVAIFPSDHFIYPEDVFVERVRQAVQAAEQLPHHVTIFGVRPDGHEPDYGWILPDVEVLSIGQTLVRGVQAFVEKPPSGTPVWRDAPGALWNTSILIARIETLWELGARLCPREIQLFERLASAIDTTAEQRVLERIYHALTPRNLSFDFLTRIPHRLALIELCDVRWCDWGTPERIIRSLQAIGKTPLFPVELVPPRQGGPEEIQVPQP